MGLVVVVGWAGAGYGHAAPFRHRGAFSLNGQLELQGHRPRGPMDNASAYGAGDCRSESCRGHFLILLFA